MYVNQIDEIISHIIDDLYLGKISKSNPISDIISGEKKNFVEYRDKINEFIKSYVDSINISPLQKLINNKENLQRIINIIKRYVAYYCFLYMAFNYTGSREEFRNNLIQYSKLQELSQYSIKNFYDTENNYRIVQFFKIIKDSKKLLLMTPLQQKTLNISDYKDTITFLNTLGKKYIDTYILTIVEDKKGNQTVEINIHNFIKTIVFTEIYQKQEQTMVVKILSDVEATESEYTWIDIVVTGSDLSDLGYFQTIFSGETNGETLAYGLYELSNEYDLTSRIQNHEKKNNLLFEAKGITPIVDDFLRYHRDIERLDADSDQSFIIPSYNKDSSHERNVQLALMRQNKKKKENTKVQLIVNKIDMISDLYSESVKPGSEVEKEIKKLFYPPLSHRKAVSHNYLDEIYVMRKMELQGKKIIEDNEYYLELKQVNTNAYFNFKDFKKYGVSVILENKNPINMLRYSDIEYIDHHKTSFLDTRTGVSQSVINVTGLAIGPFVDGPIQCMYKENLIDIRKIEIKSNKTPGKIYSGENGFDIFVKIISKCLINTINVKTKPFPEIYYDYSSLLATNPSLAKNVIYWIYDTEKDVYTTDTYENIKMYNFQDNIRFMNARLYDIYVHKLKERMKKIINQNHSLSAEDISIIIQNFRQKFGLRISKHEENRIITQEFLMSKPKIESMILEIADSDRFEIPAVNFSGEEETLFIKIDMTNPVKIHAYSPILSHLTKDKNITSDSEIQVKKFVAHCRHESEWNDISKLKNKNINDYNSALSQFITKYAIETPEYDFVCRICSQFLPIKQFVQDGKFDNATQRFTTNYLPTYVPLNEIKEYVKYTLMINYISLMIDKISLFTGITAFSGDHVNIKQKRKTLIKNIIDIFIKHNTNNLKDLKENSDMEVSMNESLSKNFGIDKNISEIFYFEPSDSMFDTSAGSAGPQGVEINKMKKNILLLYIILAYILELNSTHILGLTVDKIANIFNMGIFEEKVFNGLYLKKNINGQERVPITAYPVLCYLIIVVSYYLMKYGYWFTTSTAKGSAKTLNVFVIKKMAHSMVELINGFAIESGNKPNDFIYSLTTNKIYTQMSSTFKDTDIIRLLKDKQSRYSGKEEQSTSTEKKMEELKLKKEDVEKYEKIKKMVRRSYKLGGGMYFGIPEKNIYKYIYNNTNETNCKSGDFHKWKLKGGELVCDKCGMKESEVSDDISELDDLTIETFYFMLKKLAKKRCIDGNQHDFPPGKSVCSLCGMDNQKDYSIEELNKLINNVRKLETDKNIKVVDSIRDHIDESIIEEEQAEKILKKIIAESEKVDLLNDFIKESEKLMGELINLGSDTKPMYLRGDSYIIDHLYNGSKLDKPIIFSEKDNRVTFKENHPSFGLDVYFYVDNRSSSIDVYYDAVSLRLIGFKEKNKEVTKVSNSNNYLVVSQSLQNKILHLGFESRYLRIPNQPKISDSKPSDSKTSDSKTLYQGIVDNLIRKHIKSLQAVIDKFSMITSMVVNNSSMEESSVVSSYNPYGIVSSNKVVDLLVQKYSQLLNMSADISVFSDWNKIRDLFVYEGSNWGNIIIRITSEKYISSDIIYNYCKAASYIIHYLIQNLLAMISFPKERIDKINMLQFCSELVNYLHSIYDTTLINNNFELMRFETLLDGSQFMIDVLRKQHGLIGKELVAEREDNIDPSEKVLSDISAETLDEMKEEEIDAREEAESLDMEESYYQDENAEDYVEGGDEE